MGEISGAMVSRLLLLATLALCGLAHSTVEVQELHDDLGPVDPIVMLQREQLGEDSELSMLSEEDQSGRKESAEEKQLTWNCDMAKKCKCAGKMMAQGADREDMRMLEEMDQMFLLQVDESKNSRYSVVREAAKFSGFKWETPQKAEGVKRVRDAHVVGAHVTLMQKYLSSDPEEALSKSDSVQKVIDATKSLQKKDVQQAQKAQLPTPSTKGIGKVMKEAEDEDELKETQGSIEAQGNAQQKCIAFCSMLAEQSAERAEKLAGDKKKVEMQEKVERLKQQEKADEKSIQRKKEELKDEEKDVTRAKVKQLKDKEDEDKLKEQKAEEKASSEESKEKLASRGLARASKKLIKKLKDLREASAQQKKKEENAAALAKAQMKEAKIVKSEEALKREAGAAMKKAAEKGQKADKKGEQKDQAEEKKDQAEQKSVDDEKAKVEKEAEANFNRAQGKEEADKAKAKQQELQDEKEAQKDDARQAKDAQLEAKLAKKAAARQAAQNAKKDEKAKNKVAQEEKKAADAKAKAKASEEKDEAAIKREQNAKRQEAKDEEKAKEAAKKLAAKNAATTKALNAKEKAAAAKVQAL